MSHLSVNEYLFELRFEHTFPVEEGRVKLELSYGINSTSPAVLLESTALVADGKNHRVRTKISSDFISIRVDDGIVFTQAVPKVG